MFGKFLKNPVTATQDLSQGALSYTTPWVRKFKLDQVLIGFSQAVSETVSVILVSNIGTNYNRVLQSVTLVAETDFVFRPQGEANFNPGDQIRVTCTNANLVGTAYLELKASEL